MKVVYFYVLLLTSNLSSAQIKNETDVKISFKPEATYTVTDKSIINMEITYFGSDDFLQALDSKGVKNPTISQETSEKVMQISTGKLTHKANFPVILKILSTTDPTLKTVLKEGTEIYGHSTSSTFPVFESMSGNYDKEFEEAFLQTIQALLSQVKYPEGKIKIGESISIDTPLTLPLGPVTLNMNIKSTYKLVSITNNIAEFDIVMVYTMTGRVEGYDIKAGGNGTGNMSYLTNKSYFSDYNVDLGLNMEMNLGEGKAIKMKMLKKSAVKADVRIKK